MSKKYASCKKLESSARCVTEWLTNPVIINKKDGKERMCADFISLNKACPQDLFRLLRAGQGIDSTTNYVCMPCGLRNTGATFPRLARSCRVLTPPAPREPPGPQWPLDPCGASFRGMPHQVSRHFYNTILPGDFWFVRIEVTPCAAPTSS